MSKQRRVGCGLQEGPATGLGRTISRSAERETACLGGGGGDLRPTVSRARSHGTGHPVRCTCSGVRPTCDGPVRQTENHLIDLLLILVHEAIRCAELLLPPTLCAEQVALGMWAPGVRRPAIIKPGPITDPVSIDEAFQTTRARLNLLADCLDWRPLSTKWDYKATRRGVRLHLMKNIAKSGRPEGQLPAAGAMPALEQENTMSSYIGRYRATFLAAGLLRFGCPLACRTVLWFHADMRSR